MLNIKRIFKYLFLSSFLLHSNSFASEFLLKLHPYVGADAKWRHMGFESGYGDNLFRKNVTQGNVYFGFDINSWFALEGGYESTFKATKKVSMVPGTLGLGYTVDSDDPVEDTRFTSKLRGWYIDFMAFTPSLPQDDSIRFFGGIGFSHKRLILIQSPFAVNGNFVSSAEVEEARRTFTKRKTLARLSIGAQKMLNERWGIRTIVNWENTNKFHALKSKENPEGVTSASVKNSMSVGLGIFLKL